MKAFSKIFCRVFFTVDKVCCYRCVETDKDLLVGVLCQVRPHYDILLQRNTKIVCGTFILL